jgi:hypothetical protein
MFGFWLSPQYYEKTHDDDYSRDRASKRDGENRIEEFTECLEHFGVGYAGTLHPHIDHPMYQEQQASTEHCDLHDAEVSLSAPYEGACPKKRDRLDVDAIKQRIFRHPDESQRLMPFQALSCESHVFFDDEVTPFSTKEALPCLCANLDGDQRKMLAEHGPFFNMPLKNGHV